MAFNKIFSTPEEILAEFRRQQEESEAEEDVPNEVSSDSEDEVLYNSDNCEDEFDGEEEDYYNNVVSGFLGTEKEMNAKRYFEMGKDEDSIWTNNPVVSEFSRTPASNIITHLPGPKGEARGVTDEDKLFSLFITDEMIEKIVSYTNEEIEKYKEKFKSEQWYIHPTDALELKALVGLLYLSGNLKDSGLSLENMFSPIFGSPMFRCTMTKNRFEYLLANIRFDSKTTRESRKSTDKFAAFREVWNAFQINCSKYYSPSEYVTVDETLLSFRGRCSFRTYIPSKPDKYGLKIISLCDARTFYYLQGIPYIGKGPAKKKNDLPLPAQYVLSLTEPLKGSNRNVTCDNWFSSIELTGALLSRKLTFVGTLRKDKKQIPQSMLAKAPVGSSNFMYQDNKMLCSFTPKKQNKKVLLISSMHSTGTVNKDKLPEIIEFYNMTKGGVDVLDKLMHSQTTKRKTRRWPMRYFYGVLDIVGVNAFVLYKWNQNKESYPGNARSTFLQILAYNLTKPLMERRLKNQRLPVKLRIAIGELLGKDVDFQSSTNSQAQERGDRKRRRCGFCDSSRDRKGNESCNKCKKVLCGEHKIVVCPTCNIPNLVDEN